MCEDTVMPFTCASSSSFLLLLAALPELCSAMRALPGGSHWQGAHRRGTPAGCMLTSNAWIKNRVRSQKPHILRNKAS